MPKAPVRAPPSRSSYAASPPAKRKSIGSPRTWPRTTRPRKRLNDDYPAHSPRAAFGIGQDGPHRVRPRASRHGRRVDLDRRHGRCVARRRACGQGRRGPHGVSRDARRPRENAASEGARRAAGGARQRAARCASRQARHRADRSAGGQSLPVRGHRRRRRRLRRVHREHRHRRSGAHPRRGQKSFRRDGASSSRRTTMRCWNDARQRRRDNTGAAQGARCQGVCAHGGL